VLEAYPQQRLGWRKHRQRQRCRKKQTPAQHGTAQNARISTAMRWNVQMPGKKRMPARQTCVSTATKQTVKLQERHAQQLVSAQSGAGNHLSRCCCRCGCGCAAASWHARACIC
jgi:hypothetical protein